MHTDIDGNGVQLLDLIGEHTTVTFRGYIDSRELIEARDEATALRDELTEDGREPTPEDIETAKELTAIIEGVDEIEREAGHGDWEYGATFIPESEFEDYARELASDIGAINEDAAWPACHIDWKAAAQSLQQDYMSVEIDGETYLCRA